MIRRTLSLLFFFALTLCAKADDSIYVLKRVFSETYHLNKNCPVIVGKKVHAYSLSDETETRQLMRNALQLADPCKVCHTPNIRNTRDNRLDDVLADYFGQSLFLEEEEEDSLNIVFDDNSIFDDEVVAGLPKNAMVTSKDYIQRGHRFKMLEVKRALDDRLIGCPITCEVVYSRKSNLSGAEGILTFRPLYVTTDDGTIIRIKSQDITIRGRNRSNIKRLLFPTIIPWFIAGEGAKVRPEDEFIITLDPLSETVANSMIKKEMEQKRKAAENGEENREEGRDEFNWRVGGGFPGGGGGFPGGGFGGGF